MKLILETFAARKARRVEVVERKGLGHPDTLCDAIAERFCVRLCQFYLERFGLILHHNVDKVLLCGGAALPAFGGGRMTEPIELYLSGRATKEWRGVSIPVEEIAGDACRSVLCEVLPELDVERHVKVIPRLRPGSGDLTSLFDRSGGTPLSNDTSCGAGFAPPTDLERVVLAVERRLNAVETKRQHPEIGADIKVMGVRTDERIALTVGCAFIDRYITGLDEYVRKKNAVRDLVDETARELTALDVATTVNAADNIERSELFLTVSGTSAEAGDDGEVGRGNRASGLITPYRWMTLEAAAGKNPVSHVGKLYNVLAARIAARIATDVRGVRDVSCLLVSQIGRPIDDPELAHVEAWADAPELERRRIEELVHDALGGIVDLRAAILTGEVSLF